MSSHDFITWPPDKLSPLDCKDCCPGIHDRNREQPSCKNSLRVLCIWDVSEAIVSSFLLSLHGGSLLTASFHAVRSTFSQKTVLFANIQMREEGKRSLYFYAPRDVRYMSREGFRPIGACMEWIFCRLQSFLWSRNRFSRECWKSSWERDKMGEKWHTKLCNTHWDGDKITFIDWKPHETVDTFIQNKRLRMFQGTSTGLFYNKESSVVTQTCLDANFGSDVARIAFAWYVKTKQDKTPPPKKINSQKKKRTGEWLPCHLFLDCWSGVRFDKKKLKFSISMPKYSFAATTSDPN